MKKVKTLILRTAGTNCDIETAHAFRVAGAEPRLVHINALIKDPGALMDYHIMAIPGGFTYGDDIGSGVVLANEFRNALSREFHEFIAAGRLVLGICNGFQVLVKMGILPDTAGKRAFRVEATLGLNDSGRFEDRWVHLKKDASPGGGGQRCVWTKDLPEITYIPVAHAEGKFIPGDARLPDRLKKNGQIVFRYVTGAGGEAAYPDNPNGSFDDIAGICDRSGRVLGLMPHPERHMTYLQHPNWRREGARSAGMGIGIELFKSGVAFAAEELL
ncbi:MAG: phosphoribosylformylglycinamidine synthase I [Candidatus Omnitrophica bacterium]|nr:phosphoribosylformylglycinamidine synthase I [Candidatus Omnitrophota bacterium]